MKPARSILSAALAASMGGIPLTLQAAGPATTMPAVVAPAAQSDALVRAIRQAQDPSAAVQAYHAASTASPSDLAVEKAYVARMVDFGLPEMADVQAQEVTRRDPQDGLAWAVAAYMNAKRGNNDVALDNVATAVRLDAGNTFVLRTAGQIVAWYDSNPDKPGTSGDVRSSLALIKAQLASNPTYAEAYRNAGEAYREFAAADNNAPGTQPAAGGEQPWVSTYPYSYNNNANPTTQPPADTGAPDTGYTYTYTAPPDTTYTTNNTYYTYPNPYVSYPYYADWWPGPYWGGFWWWPTFSSVVIVCDNNHNNNHHHDGFHGHNGFHDQHNNGFNSHDPTFFHNHGNDFAFTHPTGSHVAHGGMAVRDPAGTTNTRTGRDAFASSAMTPRQWVTSSSMGRAADSRVLIPSDRGGMTTTIHGTGIAPTRQTPIATGGGGQRFVPNPSFGGRPASAGPGMSATRAPSFGGGGGGAHFAGSGGGAHFSGGGGGAHFGGGGSFGGGGGGGHFGGGGGMGGGHR